MKFQVTSGSFFKALAPLVEIATKGTVKDAEMAHRLTVMVDADGITVSAHGGRLAMKSLISDTNTDGLDYKHETGGEVTVDAGHLSSAFESFQGDRVISVELDGKELKLTCADDTDQFQTMPIFKDAVSVPAKAPSFSKRVKISRDIFLHGLKRIFFAIGDEDSRVNYLYWMFVVDKKQAHFIAGSGARFAMLDISGDSFMEVGNKCTVFFPKDQSKVIETIVKEMDAEHIIIEEADRTSSSPAQIVLTVGDKLLYLVALDPDVKYPPMEKLVKPHKSLHFHTKVADWEYATRGMDATYTKDFKSQHKQKPALLEVDVPKGSLTIKTNTPLKANRKVEISKLILNDDDVKKMKIKCPGPLLKEIPKYSTDDEVEVLINGTNTMSPVCVRQFARTNQALGISESFQVFMTALDQEDD